MVAAFASVAIVLLSTRGIAEEQKGRLEEVVVTAERRESLLQQTPISITAFTADTLEQIGAYNVETIGEITPNLVTREIPASRVNMTVQIRGVGGDQPNINEDGKVGLYLDGVYIGKNAGALFDIADLERIEVLRGPQGTLYGKNTIGGAVNLITKKPKGEWAFKQQFTVGNFGRLRSITSVDLPAIASLSTKLTYAKKKFDGWAKNDHPRGPRHMGDADDDALRLSLLWEPVEDFAAAYSYDETNTLGAAKVFQISAVNLGYDTLANNIITSLSPFTMVTGNPFAELTNSGVVTPATHRLDRQALDNLRKEDGKINGHNLTLSWNLVDVELKSISAFRKLRVHIPPGGTDLDGGAWVFPIYHAATFNSGGDNKWYEQFTQEFQVFGSTFEDRLHYTSGVFYSEDKGEHFNNRNDAVLAIPGSVLGLPDQYYWVSQDALLGVPRGIGSNYAIKGNSLAVYGQATWHWADQLKLTAGLRYTEDTKEATILDDPAKAHVKKDWSQLTWDVTANYLWTDKLSTYAKVATGYSAGTIPVRVGDPSGLSRTANPETVTDYEVGIKSDWLNGTFRLNASVFYYDFKDMQINDWQSGQTIAVNAGKAGISGGEIEVVALPLEGVMISATYGYVDYDFKKYQETVPPPPGSPPGTPPTVGDVADTAKAPFAPEQTGSLTVNYTLPSFAFGRLSASVTGTYTDSMVFNPKNITRDNAKSYSLLNARVALSEIPMPAGELRIAAWGKNLLDKEYRVYGIDFGTLGIAGNTYGDPRAWGLDVVYEY